MKNAMICLLLLAVLAACSGDKKETTVSVITTEASEPMGEVLESNSTDSLGVDVQQLGHEIDDLLKGI